MARYKTIASRLTPELEAAILAAVKDCCSYSEIRERTGVSDHFITSVKRKNNLMAPPTPRTPVASSPTETTTY